jgi:hypothetical protein
MEIEHIDEETISYHALFTLDVIVWFLACASIRYTTVAYNKKIHNQIPMKCVLPYVCNRHKVLSYKADRDDWGKAYRSLHKAWVQAMYVPRNTLRLNGEP